MKSLKLQITERADGGRKYDILVIAADGAIALSLKDKSTRQLPQAISQALVHFQWRLNQDIEKDADDFPAAVAAFLKPLAALQLPIITGDIIRNLAAEKLTAYWRRKFGVNTAAPVLAAFNGWIFSQPNVALAMHSHMEALAALAKNEGCRDSSASRLKKIWARWFGEEEVEKILGMDERIASPCDSAMICLKLARGRENSLRKETK